MTRKQNADGPVTPPVTAAPGRSSGSCSVSLRRPVRLRLATETIRPIIGSKEALCVTLTRSELIQQEALAVLMALTSQSSGMDGLQPPPHPPTPGGLWCWAGGRGVLDASGQITETGRCRSSPPQAPFTLKVSCYFCARRCV